MTLRSALRTLTAACGFAVSAAAYAELYVVANPAVHLDDSDIKDVFKGEKQFAGAVKLVPIDNGAAQEIFLADVMRMDAARYNTIWTKKSFREGLIPPPVKSGDIEVISYVRRTPGAVGYVVSPPPNGVILIRKY
ncbi:MAG: phosphate ABC transporter substrate-binding protein [Rhodocyclales bacterium]|nr:phosphate ABC transporter substrate-binding protein [Rhodocyclales bacterium]